MPAWRRCYVPAECASEESQATRSICASRTRTIRPASRHGIAQRSWRRPGGPGTIRRLEESELSPGILDRVWLLWLLRPLLSRDALHGDDLSGRIARARSADG